MKIRIAPIIKYQALASVYLSDYILIQYNLKQLYQLLMDIPPESTGQKQQLDIFSRYLENNAFYQLFSRAALQGSQKICNRVVHLLIAPPATGKSYYLKKLQNRGLILDGDFFHQEIIKHYPEIPRSNLRPGKSIIVLRQIKIGTNMTIPITGATLSTFQKYMKMFKAYNYQVHISVLVNNRKVTDQNGLKRQKQTGRQYHAFKWDQAKKNLFKIRQELQKQKCTYIFDWKELSSAQFFEKLEAEQ